MRVFLHIFGQACCRLIMFSAQSDHDEFMSRLLTGTVLHFWVVSHPTNVVCFQLSALHHLNKRYSYCRPTDKASIEPASSTKSEWGTATNPIADHILSSLVNCTSILFIFPTCLFHCCIKKFNLAIDTKLLIFFVRQSHSRREQLYILTLKPDMNTNHIISALYHIWFYLVYPCNEQPS